MRAFGVVVAELTIALSRNNDITPALRAELNQLNCLALLTPCAKYV
jgi:hypothetical protein